MRWNEKQGVRWLEADLPGARVAFSTRVGGVSTGSYESLNLGILTDDRPEAVVANRTRLSNALGLPRFPPRGPRPGRTSPMSMDMC